MKNLSYEGRQLIDRLIFNTLGMRIEGMTDEDRIDQLLDLGDDVIEALEGAHVPEADIEKIMEAL